MNEIFLIDLIELKLLKNKNEYIFMNFPYNDSLKITSFYEKIKKNERDILIQIFSNFTDIDIRTDDILGKLHIDLLKILIDERKNKIMISNIGFPLKSINFLIENFTKIFESMDTLKDKKVFIVKCELNNPENDKYLEEYFIT